MGKTKIKIDYSKCGPEGNINPWDCGKCLSVCDPCVFLRHEALEFIKEETVDPQYWRITAIWPSVCTRCFKCVEACPEQAISVKW